MRDAHTRDSHHHDPHCHDISIFTGESSACVSLYLAVLSKVWSYYTPTPCLAAWISEDLHFTEKARTFYFDLLLKTGGKPHEFRGSKQQPVMFDHISVQCCTTHSNYNSARCLRCGKNLCFLRLMHNPKPLPHQKGL